MSRVYARWHPFVPMTERKFRQIVTFGLIGLSWLTVDIVNAEPGTVHYAHLSDWMRLALAVGAALLSYCVAARFRHVTRTEQVAKGLAEVEVRAARLGSGFLRDRGEIAQRLEDLREKWVGTAAELRISHLGDFDDDVATVDALFQPVGVAPFDLASIESKRDWTQAVSSAVVGIANRLWDEVTHRRR